MADLSGVRAFGRQQALAVSLNRVRAKTIFIDLRRSLVWGSVIDAGIRRTRRDTFEARRWIAQENNSAVGVRLFDVTAGRNAEGSNGGCRCVRWSVAADWPRLFQAGLIARRAGNSKQMTNSRSRSLIGGGGSGEEKSEGRLAELLLHRDQWGERSGGWKKRVKRKTRRRSGDDCSYSLLSDLHGRVQLFESALLVF